MNTLYTKIIIVTIDLYYFCVLKKLQSELLRILPELQTITLGRGESYSPYVRNASLFFFLSHHPVTVFSIYEFVKLVINQSGFVTILVGKKYTINSNNNVTHVIVYQNVRIPYNRIRRRIRFIR